jgi:hypothetical protein
VSTIAPKPLEAVAWVRVALHANGACSVEGTIGDKRLALQLLDVARESVRSHGKEELIVVPNREVDVEPKLPLRAVGSMGERERGDP